jgi:hypothetical protein
MVEYVNVGPQGTFKTSGDLATTVAEIDATFESLVGSHERSLVLHFHGGLVSEAAGAQIAVKMAPVYKEAGAHPLTFVWETGLVETFRDNLAKLHRSEFFQKLLKWLLRRLAQRFGGLDGRGAGVYLPMTEIEKELGKPRPFDDYDDPTSGKGASAKGAIGVTQDDLATLEDDLQAEFEQDIASDEAVMAQATVHDQAHGGAKGVITSVKLAKSLAAAAFRVIRRHLQARDHGFYPTVMEELLREIFLDDLGAWVWDRMKEKAGAMWQPNEGLAGENLHVGTYVLEKTAALQAAHPDFKVHIVGHSAGSIATCEMLRAVADRHIPVHINTIVFLAPAGRCDLGVSELVDFPDRFQKFRVYTMADKYERADELVPWVYTRSLLYFISGVLERDEVDAPLMGMMRHASGNGNFAEGPAAKWAGFVGAGDRLVLSDSTELNDSAVVGLRTSSRSHGGFDDDKLTRESLTEFLRA